MGSKLASSAGVRLAGSLAIVLGVLLAVAAVAVGENGRTVLVIPGAESVGLLALAFIFGGWGIRRQMPGAMLVLAVAYVYLGTCQVLAVAEVSGWAARVEHGLFAVWLWSGVLVLGLHYREFRKLRRKTVSDGVREQP